MNEKSTLRHPWLGMQLWAGERHASYCQNVLRHNDRVYVPHLDPDAAARMYLQPVAKPDPDQGTLAFMDEKPFPRMTLAIYPVPSTVGVPCADLEAVEAMALARIFETAQVMPHPGDIWEINRASSAVAKSSRRGMGNIVLAHPETLKRLYHGSPPELQRIFSPRAEHPEEIAGWTRPFEGAYDRATRGITFWTKPVMPKDKMIVLYRGRTNQYDAAYFAFGHESEPHFYESKESYLFPAHYYARVIEFI